MSETVVFLVVRKYLWDKDDYVAAYLEREPAEQHRDLLNHEPYDPDDIQDYQVWTLPLREAPPVRLVPRAL